MSVSHDQLLLKTADTLKLLLRSDESTPRSKQKADLVQSVNELKQDMNRAREEALTLPGGEQLIEEQEEVIAMLEKLKERKKRILNKFAYEITQQAADDPSVQMEVDSMASTPAALPDYDGASGYYASQGYTFSM